MRPENLSPVQVREAVHMLLLAEFAEAGSGNSVTVKGGVNLREAAIRQKIGVLGGRSHVQARDVFDLAVLAPDSAHPDLLDFLAGGLDPATVELARARSLEISFEAYEGQVLEFVDERELSRYGSADVWDEMCLRVNRLVEQVRERQEEQ